MQADLDGLQLERRALGERRVRRDRLELALLEHEEVIEVDVLLRDEEEAPARRCLDLLQPRSRPGPISNEATFAFTSTRYAWTREPRASARSLPLEIDRGRLARR